MIARPREAQTLAALNHPNIAQIYGVVETGGAMRALVMKLVEGEDHASPCPPPAEAYFRA